MKSKALLLTLFALLGITQARADVTIDASNFPDISFRNFLRDQSYGKDGVITDTEILNIRRINVYSKNISSLQGIEFFTAMTYLSCRYNQLTELDLSQNTALTYLNCDNNKLTTLNVSQCMGLTELHCQKNNLTELDVSECIALTWLDCMNNQLISLDVSGCTALTKLECGGNQLTSFDVSICTVLTYLNCNGNQLTTLNVSQNTSLWNLYCSHNLLTELDLSQNMVLEALQCDNNQLTSLNLSQNTTLEGLGCSGNKLTKLDVSGCKALTGLYCNDNQLTSLDISKNTALTELECSGNQLTSLDISKNTALTKLVCGSNQLTSLDILKNTALTKLVCSSNRLRFLDLTKNTNLVSLHCDNNQLTSLDVTKNTILCVLYCEQNQLTSLEINKNTSLTQLYCYTNQLVKLNVSECTALTTLDCYDNCLISLDVSGCIALTWLDCYQNQIKGSLMDAFVESLPTISNRRLHIIFNEGEGNIMTYVQVAAAKEKGWTPYYYNNRLGFWYEYYGVSDPVADVIAFINAIGIVEYTDACKALIDTAREAYEALTDEQKQLVTNYDVLTAAETTYANLKAASNVIDKINAIGTVEYTDACKVLIDFAREAYNALTDEQKTLVTNYDELTAAETTYANLKAASNVIDKIYAIGTVEYTDACKALIDTAREAYEALTDTQKALVTNYETLNAAEEEYKRLEEESLGIDSMKVDSKVGIWYNLQGRKVARPTKGIYIQKRQKFLIK